MGSCRPSRSWQCRLEVGSGRAETTRWRGADPLGEEQKGHRHRANARQLKSNIPPKRATAAAEATGFQPSQDHNRSPSQDSRHPGYREKAMPPCTQANLPNTKSKQTIEIAGSESFERATRIRELPENVSKRDARFPPTRQKIRRRASACYRRNLSR